MWDSKRDTDVLNSLLDSVGESEGGMIWENGIETCIFNKCTPMADSCQCMAKPLQYCKVISLQFKWINLF